MGECFFSRAVLNIIRVLRATLLNNKELKVTFLHETLYNFVEKSTQWTDLACGPHFAHPCSNVFILCFVGTFFAHFLPSQDPFINVGWMHFVQSALWLSGPFNGVNLIHLELDVKISGLMFYNIKPNPVKLLGCFRRLAQSIQWNQLPK